MRTKPRIEIIDYSDNAIQKLRNEIKEKQKELDEKIWDEAKFLIENYLWRIE